MKLIEKLQGSIIRRILLGMITNDVVLARIASYWKGGMFASNWANLLGGWCVSYHSKYGKAPGRGIEGLFAKWSEKNRDKDTIRIVEKLLVHISREHKYQSKSIQADELLDIASEHFRKVRYEKLVKEMEGDLETNDLVKLEERLADLRKVDFLEDTQDEDIFSQQEVVLSSFDNLNYFRLVRYPGDLDKFFYNMLERGRFLAIQAVEKGGKSYMLQDIAYRALLQRKRVGFFAIGDLTKLQMRWRMFERAALRPLYSPTGKWPVTVKYPVSIERPNYKKREILPKVRWKTKTFKHPLNASLAWGACKEIMEDFTRSNKSFFKMAWYPNFSVNMDGINGKIKVWGDSGFIPDVVIIDYADLLCSPPGKPKSEQEEIDWNWKKMRALSQSLNCLVVTATQAKASAYKKRSQDRTDVGRDKRKQAHVDGFLAISQTDEEKEMEVCRLSWLVNRPRAYSTKRQIFVAGCLSVASPAVVSTL